MHKYLGLIQNSLHKIYAVSLTINWILTVQVSFEALTECSLDL